MICSESSGAAFKCDNKGASAMLTPIHNLSSRKRETLAVHTALASVKYVLPFGSGSPGPLLSLSQAAHGRVLSLGISYPGVRHSPSLALCWARCGRSCFTLSIHRELLSARIFSLVRRKRVKANGRAKTAGTTAGARTSTSTAAHTGAGAHTGTTSATRLENWGW